MPPRSLARFLLLLALTTSVSALTVRAQPNTPQPSGSAAVDERATADGRLSLIRRHGTKLPLDAAFVDDLGRTVTLRDYFDGERPVVITLNYFKCPMLCGRQLKALVDGGDGPRMEGTPAGIRSLTELPGKEYRLLTVSFDATEGPRLAGLKKKSYLEFLARDGAGSGWHFLTGKEDAVKALTEAVGFRFKWTGVEYAHPSVVVFCTPDGVVSDYMTGYNYDRAALEQRLARAAAGETSPAPVLNAGLADSAPPTPAWLWIGAAVAGLVTFLAVFFGRRVLARS